MPPTKKPAAKTSPKGKAKTCNQCSETLAEVRALFARLEGRMDALCAEVKACSPAPKDHPAEPPAADSAPSAGGFDTSPTIPAGV